MRVLFPLFLGVALGTYPVPSLQAQERKEVRPADVGVIDDVDVTVTDLTEEKLKNPPKREIKFERVEEPLKRKLTKPDPKLFEQKFAARFDLEIPAMGENYPRLLEGDVNVAKLGLLDARHLIAPNLSSGEKTASKSFMRKLAELPTDDVPAKAEREFFTNSETRGAMLDFIPLPPHQNPAQKYVWSFTILGSTPEQLKLRCQALLTILDHGACRPIQLSLFKKREPLCVQLRDQRKALEKAQRGVSVVQDELKSYADFTPDMLSNLRVQQLQLDVELAGVKARIATCERFLAQPALKTERRNQIEDLKVAAEIEFSGFEARRTKSEEIIGKVKNKVDLNSKLMNVQSKQEGARGNIFQLEEQIKNLDQAIRAYAPLPLVDNKVVIQPVEWTQ